MRWRSEYLVLPRPWSLPAFASAFIAVMFAATMQEFIASFGTTPYFVGFVPAILVASLIGGAPAGIFAAALSVPIIWWAFMPPQFQFNPLTAAQYDSFVAFALVSSLAICFAHLFREALSLIRK